MSAVDALLERCFPTHSATALLIASALRLWITEALSLTHSDISSDSLFPSVFMANGAARSPVTVSLSPFSAIRVASGVPSLRASDQSRPWRFAFESELVVHGHSRDSFETSGRIIGGCDRTHPDAFYLALDYEIMFLPQPGRRSDMPRIRRNILKCLTFQTD